MNGQYSLAESDCIARYLTRHFGENENRFLQTAAKPTSALTIHRKRSEASSFGHVSAPAHKDGYLVSLSLRGDRQQLFEGGRRIETRAHAPDSLCIRDLSERYRAYLCSPFDFLFFHIPLSALDAIARENGARRVARLDCRPGTLDPVAAGL